ncbi:MAG: hypothetical protein LBU97_03980 [Alistipes sp.]|jgi:hypothetical protein|nr:hypothetical protein [Alistipes sp.]
MKAILKFIIWAAAFISIFFAGRGCGGGGPGGNADGGGRAGGGGIGSGGYAETRTDTIFVPDTLRGAVPEPALRIVVRVDTLWLAPLDTAGPAPLDTAGPTAETVCDSSRSPPPDSVPVALPVERKTYLTADYRAVVEGFRPTLAELEIYRNSPLIIRRTVLPRPVPHRWGIGIQAGVGFTAKGTGPYVGVGVQYSILTW